MIKGIVLIAIVIAAGMAAVKDGRIIRATGLTGSCSIVQIAAGGSRLEACHTGSLYGAPNLGGEGCAAAGAAGGETYWRCPPSVAS